MRHARKQLVLSAFLVLLFAATTPAAAAVASNSALTFSGTGNSLFALPNADHQWHMPVDSAWMSTLSHAPEAYSTRLINFAPPTPPEPPEEDNDVIRHRGFRKFLVIALICGGLIRILTSPSYLKFIADALDPKVF